jgi:hypothetical protein
VCDCSHMRQNSRVDDRRRSPASDPRPWRRRLRIGPDTIDGVWIEVNEVDTASTDVRQPPRISHPLRVAMTRSECTARDKSLGRLAAPLFPGTIERTMRDLNNDSCTASIIRGAYPTSTQSLSKMPRVRTCDCLGQNKSAFPSRLEDSSQ